MKRKGNKFPAIQRIFASSWVAVGPKGNKRKNFKEREEWKNKEIPMDPPLGKLFYFDTI